MGTSWISRKGEILEKEGVDLEKGGMTPLTNYDSQRHFTIDRDDFILGQVSPWAGISRVNTLSFIFNTTHPFKKNLTTLKTLGEKLFF